MTEQGARVLYVRVYKSQFRPMYYTLVTAGTGFIKLIVDDEQTRSGVAHGGGMPPRLLRGSRWRSIGATR